MHFCLETEQLCIEKKCAINRLFCLISTKLYLPLLANSCAHEHTRAYAYN